MDIDRRYHMTPEEYRKARLALGLTIPQLAYELCVNELTLRRRESGDVDIKREAQLAILSLKKSTLGEPRIRKLPKFKVGDTFGLFTVVDTCESRNDFGKLLYSILGLRCECGRTRTVLAKNLSINTRCGRGCQARKALQDRGSYISRNGDIIDKDGFPEK